MTGKTIAIVAVAAVGAFVLVKALAPTTRPPPSKAKSVTDLVSLQGLVGLGSALGGLFGGGGSGGGSSYANPNAPVVPAGYDTSNFSTSEGFMFTDASGNFIAG